MLMLSNLLGQGEGLAYDGDSTCIHNLVCFVLDYSGRSQIIADMWLDIETGSWEDRVIDISTSTKIHCEQINAFWFPMTAGSGNTDGEFTWMGEKLQMS